MLLELLLSMLSDMFLKCVLLLALLLVLLLFLLLDLVLSLLLLLHLLVEMETMGAQVQELEWVFTRPSLWFLQVCLFSEFCWINCWDFGFGLKCFSDSKQGIEVVSWAISEMCFGFPSAKGWERETYL